jgi:hypothetical protein
MAVRVRRQDERRQETREIQRRNRRFARKLFAACVSHRLGIGLDYALKKYASEEVPGEYWLRLAKDLETGVVAELGIALSPKSEGSLQ